MFFFFAFAKKTRVFREKKAHKIFTFEKTPFFALPLLYSHKKNFFLLFKCFVFAFVSRRSEHHFVFMEQTW